MLIMIGSFIMAADLVFNRTEGWLMLCGLAALIIWMVRFGLRRGPQDPLAVEFAAEIPSDMPMRIAVMWLLIGVVILPLSSHFLVEGAVSIARSLAVSDAVIGLTIVAFGTSLPELAAGYRCNHQSGACRRTHAQAGLPGHVPADRAVILHGLRH